MGQRGCMGGIYGNGEAGDGDDSGLGGWAVRVCACVVGKRGVCRVLLWGWEQGLDRRPLREWGGW